MNGKAKKSMRKILPVGIAMGILFSASPVTEYKVKADVDTFATIVTTFGDIYDAFLKEPFGKWLEEIDAKNSYAARLENVAYKAPTFNKGEFGISVFDYNKDQNFSKKIKLVYANGKVENKTIKHGEQIRIKDAGTIVDLTPDEPELSKHDILYITQKQLDEGNTGVSLTNFKTYYLKSDNSGGKNVLADRFEQQEFPGYFLNNGSGLRDVRYANEDLFSKLPEEKRMLATITSEPVSKEVLFGDVEKDSQVREDMKKRALDIFTQHKEGQYSAISTKIINDGLNLQAGDYIHEEGNGDPNAGTDFTITPVKKGSDKVFITSVFNDNLRYLTSKKLGDRSQWVYTHAGDISSDEVWTLVNRENGQFSLQNNKGEYFYVPRTGKGAPAWTTSDINQAGKFTARLAEGKWNNWLIDWYPGKENEKKEYSEVEFDYNKSTAKDSFGNVIKNNWVKKDKDYYYAGSDGVFLKNGWQEIDGETYYFQENGKVVLSDSNIGAIDEKWYHFNDKGALQRSAWKKDGYGLHYSDASGAFIENGLREIDGKIYYFQFTTANTKEIRLEDQHVILHFSDKGVLERASRLNGEALNGSQTSVVFEGKTLIFEHGGSIRKSGISKVFFPGWTSEEKDQPVVVYYSLEEPNYSGWKEENGKKYHFDGGRSYTFDYNVNIEGKRYYFNHEGEATQTGFVKTNGNTYYNNDKGEMQTGFQEINGNKYYFSEDSEQRGKMITGLFKVGGKRYYADPNNGVMHRNTTAWINYDGPIKLCRFDSEGRITQN
ncbi:cell wall-binding protein [Bacillus mycoides]|uniref:cell wall-binding protein n=1 Tax=Bacillus mycoides TaxID=1405 RepID=UPI002E212E6C|nr:cell wall-binding protein [Bacillus mycoides]